MGYLGREWEWDQSVFGSWARDIGGQTSSRRISGDPITTSTSAAWFTPNIRHRHDLWPAAQEARGGGNTMEQGDWRMKIENNDPTLSDRAFRSKILNFWLARNLFSILYVSKWKFSLWRSHQPAFMSCPVEIYSSFHFCVRVQSPCLRVLTFLSVSVFSWLSGVRGRECLVTREIASRNIWQYLNNNKASANLNMKSLFTHSVSGHVPLISENVSEKSGASCFYLDDRTGVDSQGKEAKIDFSF